MFTTTTVRICNLIVIIIQCKYSDQRRIQKKLADKSVIPLPNMQNKTLLLWRWRVGKALQMYYFFY